MNNQYDIQNELFTSMKFWGKFLLVDAVYLLLSFQFLSLIYDRAIDSLKIPSMLVIGLLLFFWGLPSVGNKGKRNIHRLLFLLSKNRATYQSLSFYEVEEDFPLHDFFPSDEERERFQFQEE